MILYRWRGDSTNFGDELNTILWPRLLPGFFDDDPATRFLGIGSVLDRRHPAETHKIVAGAGYGGYEDKPVLDRTWIIHWVRGPRTAAALGLPQSLGLGDPAMLTPQAIAVTGERSGIGFIPHFESAARGAWQRAADLAGITLIDPRARPLDILIRIAMCRVLLSEALHGIIVADALRVPWVAIRPRAGIHRPKWRDWAETADVVPRFATLPPTTLAEWFGRSPVFASRLPGKKTMTACAARALAHAAQAEPQLSPDAALDRCQSRMLEAVAHLRRHPNAPSSRITAVGRRSYLRSADDSAYEPVPIG